MSSDSALERLPKHPVEELTDRDLDQFIDDVQFHIDVGLAHLYRAKQERKRRIREKKYGPTYDSAGARFPKPRPN